MTGNTFVMKTALLAALAAFSFSFATPASALTMKECSAKYRAAQKANTLGGLKWNDFRAKECSEDATAEPEVSLDDEVDEEPAKPVTKAKAGVPFPNKVDAKYNSLSPGKQRMRTCVDAYHAAKDAGKLGDLKWIQKGGGYYSQCNSILKGES